MLLAEAGLRSECGIHKACNRAVFVGNGRREVVGARVRERARIDRDRVDRADRRAREEAESVVHVAGFADVAAAAFRAVHPVIEREIARIHPILNHERRSPLPQTLPEHRQRRREAAVEADHQERRVRQRRVGADDRFELLPRERERLLDEHLLARIEGAHDLCRVIVMPRRDDNELERRIVQHRVEIGRQHLDLVVAREVAPARATAAHDSAEEEAIAALAHLRHEHRGAERAGADERVIDAAAGRLAVPANRHPCRLRIRFRLVGILDQDAQRQRAFRRGELVICGGRLVDRQHSVDERLEVDALRGDQLEVRLHVAVERPAYVRERIIAPFRLVGRIVPPRAVRRAHQEIDLLAVEHRPIHGEADVADDDHGTLGARDLHREVDDAVRFRGRRDDRAIGTGAAGQVAHQRLQRVGIAGAAVEPERARASDARRIEIEADHPAAGRLQELYRDVADEAEPEHRHALAELRRRAPHALHRDRADRRRCGLLQRAAVRHTADEIARHTHVVGVVRLPGSRRGNEVTRHEVVHAGADRHDFPRHGVPHGPTLRVEIVDGGRLWCHAVWRRSRSGLPRTRCRCQAPFGHLRQTANGFARIAEARSEILFQHASMFEPSLDGRRVRCCDAGGPERRDFGSHADERVADADQHRARLHHRTWHARHDNAVHVHEQLTHSACCEGSQDGKNASTLVSNSWR